MLHVVTQLDERIVAGRYFAVDSHTDAGLEMRGVLMFLGHRESDGTFREQHLAVRLDTCGATHEAYLAGQFLTCHHREKHRDVALATSRNTFVNQFADGDTTGVLDGREEVEAADRDTI